MEAVVGRVRNKKGLTLIELLAVVLIIGIIAAIAVPAVSNAIEKSKVNADKATQVLIKEAATRYALDNTVTNGATISVAALQAAGYLNPPTWNKVQHQVTTITFTVTSGTNTGDNVRLAITGPGGGTGVPFDDLTD